MLFQKSPTHFLIFSGALVFIFLFFIFYAISNAVTYDPGEDLYHTTVIYYDGDFSNTLVREDVQTGLYFVNMSQEDIKADIYEYDGLGKEIKDSKTIPAGAYHFVKTQGPGVVYLSNLGNTKRSVIKFSKWLKFQLQIPRNFFDS